LPLEFYEARNAMRIARSEGAEEYADESYAHALKLMDNADQYAIDKHHQNKQLIAISPEVVQTAEDARTIAVKRMDEARNHEERRQSENALANSQAQTADATRRSERSDANAANAQSEAAFANNKAQQSETDNANLRAQRDSERLASADAQSQTQAQIEAASRQRDKAVPDQASAQLGTNRCTSRVGANQAGHGS